MWIQISQLLSMLADQDPTVYHVAYVILQGFVNMILTWATMLKIASDDNFYLLSEKTTSAKFDPYSRLLQSLTICAPMQQVNCLYATGNFQERTF